MKKAFTTAEVLVIMVIISILGTLAMPAYMRSLEMTYDNHAKADLKIVLNAQKVYNIDMNSYFQPSTTDQPAAIFEINDALGLGLSAGTDRKWNYLTDSAGCGEAARFNGDGRTWHMNITDAEPTSGVCP